MTSLGRTIWITGLSGAGKTTLANELVGRLRSAGDLVVLLDGDELREALGSKAAKGSDHDRQSRLELAMQYARVCKLIALQGVTVVIATISLFKEVHEWSRINIPHYFEVFLDVPLDELRKRDPKKIYARFDAGEISNVAGMDLPVDLPRSPDLIVQYRAGLSARMIAEEILSLIDRKDDIK